MLQNGVEHVARFSPWLDTEQLLPVVVDLPAQRMAPGLVTQRGVARLTVAGEQGASFAALFASTAVEVSQVPELTTAMWAKLCVNVAGAVSAATLTSGMVYHDGAVADLVEAIVAECVAVGRAEGAELDDDLARRVADGYRTSPADDITSLHADRLAGRPMEIDARNGAVVRFGERHGIATPLNAALVAILRAAEAQ